jgi:hypothetical protein
VGLLTSKIITGLRSNLEVYIVDGATIFVYVLAATFLGLIVYLARLSRRSHIEVAENVTAKDSKPRKAA